MKKLFQTLKQCMLNGEDVVLVTVLASSGSTPRGAGARMIVNQNGRLYGTIGGGAVEYKAQQLASNVLKDKKSQVKGYKLVPNQIEDLGMICGGDVTVYLQFISAHDHETFSLVERILAMLECDEDSWIIMDITDETAWSMGIYSKVNGAIGMEINDDDAKFLLTSSAVQIKIGTRQYYAEPLMRAGKVVIFGGGHVSQELVPVLTHVGFRCFVMDDRPEFADIKLFPAAEQVVLGDFEKVGESVNITKNDYVVVVTRGHSHDFSVMAQVLKTDVCYVGMIGSRGKIAKTNARLLEAGISQEVIDRVYTPIGIAIKAETPAEIAVSIAAELIMVRADRAE